jgi:hypothetical protein
MKLVEYASSYICLYFDTEQAEIECSAALRTYSVTYLEK